MTAAVPAQWPVRTELFQVAPAISLYTVAVTMSRITAFVAATLAAEVGQSGWLAAIYEVDRGSGYKTGSSPAKRATAQERPLDIHDGHVRPRLADIPLQGLGIFGLGDDVDARLPQQPDDALPGEHDVFRDDYPHGISTPNRVGSTVRMPHRCTMRSVWSMML
jgi:hypothetical protein